MNITIKAPDGEHDQAGEPRRPTGSMSERHPARGRRTAAPMKPDEPHIFTRAIVERLPTFNADRDRDTSARAGAIGTGTSQGHSAHVTEVADRIPLVDRAFAFVDLCGFTTFTDTHGEHQAVGALQSFRALTRDLATRRGVRVDKWLGDGAMIIGVDTAATIATAVELIARYGHEPLALRGGVAHGQVLILDGDDYIGRPINLAARLCQAARPGELLGVGYPATTLPPWTRVMRTRSITLRGLGRIRNAQHIGLAPNIDLPPFTATAT